jgi:hypothetical protein
MLRQTRVLYCLLETPFFHPDKTNLWLFEAYGGGWEGLHRKQIIIRLTIARNDKMPV